VRASSALNSPVSAVPDLWEFSLAFYRNNDVRDDLVWLQDEAQLDVNLLLAACWLGACRGEALDTETVLQMDGAISAWREHVTKPLRAVRRILSETGFAPATVPDATLRQRVLDVEIASEQTTQRVIAEFWAELWTKRLAARAGGANLQRSDDLESITPGSITLESTTSGITKSESALPESTPLESTTAANLVACANAPGAGRRSPEVAKRLMALAHAADAWAASNQTNGQ
jgi:uncharacterized protein (TIGR02444 family)